MDPSRSETGVSWDDVRTFFVQSDNPSTPVTTAEVAESLDCATETVEPLLAELAENNVLQTRSLEDSYRLWWHQPDAIGLPEDRSQLQEFGAFVSAVKDYAIFMLNEDGAVASWNRGARRIKNYAEDEIVGEHFSTFYTQEDNENGVPEKNLEKAATEGRAEDEGWRVRKDGSRFWANVIITAIRDIDGTLQGFTKVTRDMTEQREYELQLRQERDLVEQILETIPIGITVVDSDGEFVRANQEVLELFDLDKTEIDELSINNTTLYDKHWDCIPDEERPWAQVIETDKPVYGFQCRIDTSAEPDRWLSINAVPLDGPISTDNSTVVAIEDITDQKDREHRLEQRKAELETELGEVLGRVSDAFFALDGDWKFTHLNEHAAELFQHPEEELYGQCFQETFPERYEGRVGEAFQSALDNQEPVYFEFYDDALDAWLEYNVYPSESGLSVYIHDITDRREYQRRLEESNERLEQFAHAASHDLQEPLRMVSSYLQLIENRYGDALDEDGEEFLAFAVDGADRMRGMIEGLLEYSRVDTQGQPFETVEFESLLEEVRDDLQLKIEENSADITAKPLPQVKGDHNQLSQLFQNLLDNAIEYSGDKPPNIHLSAERNGDEWVVSVSDDGVGIDPENANRAFEVFQRLHSAEEYDGTGIGLALCERIVERHGGEIWLNSAPGEGATFSFTLPAVKSESP